MYTLYNHPSDSEVRDVSLGSFERILQSHRDNLSRVIHYYRRSYNSVSSDHLLVQILQTLPSGEGLDISQYRDKVEDGLGEIIRVFNLTSPIHVGTVTDDSEFLGYGFNELLLCISKPFSIGEIKNNWINASPVTFFRHPLDNLNMEVPDGERKQPGKGLVVVNIDIPLLACQYRLWREREKRLRPDIQRTPMQFVYQIPVTNALGSLTDISFFNRIHAIFDWKKVEDVPHNHPFYLNTYIEKTNEGLIDMVDHYTRSRLSFGEVLESIQPIHNATLQEAIAFPSMAFTRQVKWALSITRFPLISLMLEWDAATHGSLNREDKNRVKRSIRQLRGDRSLDSFDNDAIYDIVNDELENDIKSYFA